ncbi:MAG: HAD-IIA family hydrolase [Actinomycetota bacterium]
MLADHYDAFLLDLDGTLYRGEEPIPGAAEAVHRLHAAGQGVCFLTNNSGRTRRAIADKLNGFGIEAEADEVVSSALATAALLAERGVRRVYPVCGDGLLEELGRVGIEIAEEVPDGGAPTGVEVVVVGWHRTATYDRLKTACLLVERGALLVASNADASFPAPDGLWPGAGALLALITTTTEAVPEIVGKPNAPLFQAALASTGGSAPLVVGDRLDTDIAGAAALGWDTLLVYSGIAQPGDAERLGVSPSYAADDLSALFSDPEPPRFGGP